MRSWPWPLMRRKGNYDGKKLPHSAVRDIHRVLGREIGRGNARAAGSDPSRDEEVTG
jgi:hypothetical protein